MKKFYTFALAAVVAVSASAKSYEISQISGRMKARNVEKISLGEKSDLSLVTKMVKVKAAADAAAAPIEGDYRITIGDYYFQSSVGDFTESAKITRDGDKITISCDYFVDDVTAAYDEATGAITFTEGAVEPFNNNGTVLYYQFRPFAYDEKKGIVAGSYSATYADGIITFPADHGFSWPAFGDEAMTTSKGYMDLFDVISLETKANFVEYTECDWTENLIFGLFGQGDAVNTAVAKTAVTYNKVDKYYEIGDAFQATYAKIGFTSSSPALKVDASDPDNCVIELNPTGINGGEEEGEDGDYYLVSRSFAVSDPTAVADDQRIKCVEDEKTITITFPVKSTLLYAAGVQKLYTASPAVSTLVINKEDAGVSDIVVDQDSNAPVEYYNLQGVRVAEPAAGQLVIRRQGTKVAKVLVK